MNHADDSNCTILLPCQKGLAKGENRLEGIHGMTKLIQLLFSKLVVITLRFKIDSVELLERITALVYNSLPFLVSSILKLSVVGNYSHVG